MFCPNCGKEIPENIKFCNHCGAAQDNAAAQNIQSVRQDYEPRLPTMNSRTKTAFRIGGIILLALSTFSMLMSLIYGLYNPQRTDIFYAGAILPLIQSCMIVGGILLVCVPKPEIALKAGGITLLALSALFIFTGLYHHFQNYSWRPLTYLVAPTYFARILLESCMVAGGILMLYATKGTRR